MCYHELQALQYLLKLCSHPLLVIHEEPPDYLSPLLSEVIPDCADILVELHKLHHSPKLVALQEILEECGIGLDTSISDGAVAVGQHRVLIFAQHKVNISLSGWVWSLIHIRHAKVLFFVFSPFNGTKHLQSFLDIIERDLFVAHMKRLVISIFFFKSSVYSALVTQLMILSCDLASDM